MIHRIICLTLELRQLFLERLAAAFAAGDLGFFGELALLADPATFAERLAAMRKIDWVVYAKKPFGGPAQVLAYLGRYTHRTAKLALCRSLSGGGGEDTAVQGAAPSASSPSDKIAVAIPACPHCGGVMHIVGCMPRSFHRPGPGAPLSTSASPLTGPR